MCAGVEFPNVVQIDAFFVPLRMFALLEFVRHYRASVLESVWLGSQFMILAHTKPFSLLEQESQ